MTRAVIDANVLLSGATGSTTPAQVVDAWRRGRYVLITSPQLMEEINAVMRRPDIMSHFNLTEELITGFMGTLSTRAYVSPGILNLDILKSDPADNQVLAAAVEGTANYIVTGDQKHLLPLGSYQGIPIIKPIDFLSKIL